MTVGTLSDTLSVPSPDTTSADVFAARDRNSSKAAAAKVRRNETIDAIRLVAAAGIVLVHATESSFFETWKNLFRFGVPFFLFASLYYQSLSLRRNADRPLGKIIFGRFERLYLPFLAWSVIYLVSRDIERMFLHHLPPVQLRLSMLWTGTEYHLWFLPYLLGLSIALSVLYRGVIQRDARYRWLVIATAVMIACAISTRPVPHMPGATEMTFDDPGFAYFQWFVSSAAAFGALAFACFMTFGSTIYEVPTILGWAGLALVMACSLRQALHGIAFAPRALTGVGSMLLALAPWKSSAIPAMARVGRMGYGIYLCHVIPVEILHIVAHRLHLHPSVCLDLTSFALSFLGAIGIVVLLGKSPRLAWLNG
jgi:peptidoglycan/LPS O-acetylase OafA/YrhL